MKVTHKIKQLEASKRLLKIDVGPEEIAAAYEEVYKRIQREVVLPGFRKGNAPLDLIRAGYKDYAREKVVEFLLEESYRSALKDAGFLPVAMPKIENISFPEKGNFSFDATVEIRPQVELKNYKGLDIRKKNTDVKDSEIDSALENFREMRAQYKAVPARPVKEGDFILCDLEWLSEGKSIEKKEKVVLPVDKKSLAMDVFNGIQSANVGEKKSISINIDKNFHKPEYIGKSGTLEVNIQEIKEKQLPVLDDQFAKEMGPFENLAALKEKIKEHLLSEKTQASQLDMEDQAMQQLLKSHSFELPQSLVDTEFKNLLHNAKHRLLEQGYSEADAASVMEKEKDSMEKKFTQHAQDQVKAFFIIEEIAEKENLLAGEEEVDHLIEALAARQNKPAANLKSELAKDEKMNSLYWQLTEAKTMEFLLKNAKIEEEK